MVGGARVLVTDGDQRSTLAVVRSLGRAGYQVAVTSAGGRSLAGASRYALRDRSVGNPMDDPSSYADALDRTFSEWGAELLIPMTEATLRSVLRHLPHDPSRIPSGDLERFLRISDKATVLATAGEAGIAVPAQWTVERKAQVGTILDSDLPMPVVVKPGRSVARAVDGGMLKTSVQHARDRGELRRILNGLPTSAFPVLLQQRVTGPGVGVFLLVWEGRLLARFAHRRLREKPPSGGVSVYRESTAMDPALLDRSVDLLRRFEWDGVAMVEYKVDASTGTPYLMEINPRFWGSLQLAIDAGVDFPRLLVSAARGQPVEGPEDYRTGVRSRWWWGDIDHLLIRLKGSTETLHLPPDAGGVASAVWDFLHLWRPGDRSEVLRLSDPRPILRETRLWFRS